MERFAGKVAVVTGSSGGIGSAISEALLKRNLKVVGLDVHMDKLEILADNLNSKINSKFYPRQCDVTNEGDIKSTFKWVEENIGPIWILINAAGVALSPPKSIQNMEGKDFDKIFNVNSRGLVLCANEAFRYMINNDVAGHIINICSVLGHDYAIEFGVPVYSASKHVVRVFSAALQRSVKKKKANIKITNVSPGLVNTDIIKQNNWVPPTKKELILSPEDIANGCISVIDTPPNVLISQFTIEPIN